MGWGTHDKCGLKGSLLYGSNPRVLRRSNEKKACIKKDRVQFEPSGQSSRSSTSQRKLKADVSDSRLASEGLFNDSFKGTDVSKGLASKHLPHSPQFLRYAALNATFNHNLQRFSSIIRVTPSTFISLKNQTCIKYT